MTRSTRQTTIENKEDARMTANALALDPTRTALLMMDFQPAVLAAVPDGEQALDRARAALSWARSHDVQVAHVRVAFSPDDHAAVPVGNKAFAPIAAGALLADGSPETALHESIDVHQTDILVRKTRIGAFASGTDLRALLRERGVDTLVLAGLSTGGVVLTTLRQAADPTSGCS
jgi:nicotinamidase-related amidase